MGRIGIQICIRSSDDIGTDLVASDLLTMTLDFTVK